MAVSRGAAVPVRTLVLAAGAALLAWMLALAVYMSAIVVPRARDMRGQAQTLSRMYDRITARAARRQEAIDRGWVMLARSPRAVRGERVAPAALRRFVLDLSAPAAAPVAFADVPGGMRRSFALADELGAQVEIRLLETVALAELRDTVAAVARLRIAEQVADSARAVLATAYQQGLADLSARESALGAAIERTLVVLVWWVAGGSVLVAVLLLALDRRIRRPMRVLEAGLGRVASGDLSARLPVTRDDELGALTRQFNDMTQVLRTRAEEQGRFVAAGQLMADVAHEVNNPLMAISALADAGLRGERLPPGVADDFAQIRRQAQRAGKLLGGLLRFVRQAPETPTPLHPNEVIRSAADLVSYLFGVEEIAFELDLAEDLPPAQGVPARLEQVLVNLLSNAVQALRAVPAPRRLRARSRLVEGWIRIEVEDEGPGVAPEFVDRLFRPFATTKGADGTGLGLYISRQIMRDAGGDLRYEPAGRGARFVALLPAASGARSAPAAAPPPPRPGRLAGLRVLVVDDEDAVRAPIARFLARAGAAVAQAGDGREALARLEEERFDAILLDLRMPVMGGAACFQALLASRPALAGRVIFLSGDLAAAEREGIAMPADRLLLKPADLGDIERKVLEVAERLEPAA